jgi:hypothetical protein
MMYIYNLNAASYRWLMLIAEFNQQCAANGIQIDRQTAVTRCCGEIMDYDLAVFARGTRVDDYRSHPETFPRKRFDEEPM